MVEPTTRATLFIPGPAESLKAWKASLKGSGLGVTNGTLRGDGISANVSVEWVENDGAFGAAFSFGTVAPEVVDVIDKAPGALVLQWPIDLRDGRQEIVSAVERLRDAGALAVRLEQSKVGWEVSRWIELLSSVAPGAWHRGCVAFLGDDKVLQSCGMHAFSLPDVYLTLDDDGDAAERFATVLNVYQLAEDPVLLSGQSFTPDRDTPRRVVERWPATLYPSDHPCHNPYGVWRIGPSGGTARPQAALATVFMPALRVLLMALEAEAGVPLTKDELQRARDGAACVAMEHRDAQKLERSRGYADLDPELAWEQWQLVRDDGA